MFPPIASTESTVVHANGWIELEEGHLLSPHAVHHVDSDDEERKRLGSDGDRGGRDETDDESDDHSRTTRFNPK